MAYLATRGRCWSVGSSSNGGRRDHDHHRDLLPSDGAAHRNHGPRDRAIVTIRSPEVLLDGGDINRDLFLQIGRLAMELPDGGSSDS